MVPKRRPAPLPRLAASIVGRSILTLAAICAAGAAPVAACVDGRTLDVGFFHDFVPVSYSADPNPDSPGFDTHRGYEADLLTALEAMGGLSLSRRAIGGEFAGIWLKAADERYDLVGGGITVREDRTYDSLGRQVIAFTSGHIAFPQTLLVRAEDAERLADYDDLTSDVTVGLMRSTTGEERLLQLTGYIDGNGILRAGVRVHVPGSVLTADGTADYTIGAAGASANLGERQRLEPPAGETGLPQAIYFANEDDQIGALGDGTVDAVARGVIGNTDAAAASGGALVISARDDRDEYGGFALAIEDRELIACLDQRLGYLTDSLRIGYEQWRADPEVFLRRAETWPGRAAEARERIGPLHRSILPEVARALSANTVEAVTGRMDSALSQGSTAPSPRLTGLASSLAALRAPGGVAPHRVATGSSFVLPLDDTGGAAPGGIALWGSGAHRSLSGGGEDGAPAWDGGVTGGYLGADARLRPDVLAGLAVSWSNGFFDYAGGDYSVQVTAAHPYAGWSPSQGLGLWAVGSYGTGEVEVEDDGAGRTLASDLTFEALATGGDRILASSPDLIAGGATSLALKGEASGARIEMDGGDAATDVLTVDVHRVRAALAARHERALSTGARFVPWLEIGIRHDGGDGMTGAGAEIGGGLRYADPLSGVTVEGRGRWLAAHRSALEEWGLSGSIRFDPGADGRGVSLGLAPALGAAAGGTARLWERGLAGETAGADAGARLDATVGYGVSALGGCGLLIPYAAIALGSERGRTHRMGARFALGRAFAASFEGGHHAVPEGAPDRRITLRGHLKF